MRAADELEGAKLEPPNIYEPIASLDSLKERMLFFMGQYNKAVLVGKLDLVFLKDAMSTS